jgi:hypothetical protein
MPFRKPIWQSNAQKTIPYPPRSCEKENFFKSSTLGSFLSQTSSLSMSTTAMHLKTIIVGILSKKDFNSTVSTQPLLTEQDWKVIHLAARKGEIFNVQLI